MIQEIEFNSFILTFKMTVNYIKVDGTFWDFAERLFGWARRQWLRR